MSARRTSVLNADAWFSYACQLEGEIELLRRLLSILLVAHARERDLRAFATAEIDRVWPEIPDQIPEWMTGGPKT